MRIGFRPEEYGKAENSMENLMFFSGLVYFPLSKTFRKVVVEINATFCRSALPTNCKLARKLLREETIQRQ
jgi:hypothetical protein